jgi:hypothetical protein
MIRFAMSALVTTGLALALSGTAQAGGYVHKTYYKSVTTYVTKPVHYTVKVTKYDHCGEPYCVYVDRCRYVEVPCVKRIAISCWEPGCCEE